VRLVGKRQRLAYGSGFFASVPASAKNDKSNGMERDEETDQLAVAVKRLSEDLHELIEVNQAHLEHIQRAQRRTRWILALVILVIIATFAIDLTPVALILKYVH
jgi:hypothetical protein